MSNKNRNKQQSKPVVKAVPVAPGQTKEQIQDKGLVGKEVYNSSLPSDNVQLKQDMKDMLNSDLDKMDAEAKEIFKELEADSSLYKQWEAAQKAEREQHKFSYVEGLMHYSKAYANYFRFVGLGNNLEGLNIIEVGPADFPALAYCTNVKKGIVVEPMPSPILNDICEQHGLILVNVPFESVTFTDLEGVKEVWFFNLLQHVADPEIVIDAAKKVADRIRFFEPINEPITEYHLHTFTIEHFQNWFGQVNLYKGGTVPGFHTADCVYGVWLK